MSFYQNFLQNYIDKDSKLSDPINKIFDNLVDSKYSSILNNGIKLANEIKSNL